MTDADYQERARRLHALARGASGQCVLSGCYACGDIEAALRAAADEHAKDLEGGWIVAVFDALTAAGLSRQRIGEIHARIGYAHKPFTEKLAEAEQREHDRHFDCEDDAKLLDCPVVKGALGEEKQRGFAACQAAVATQIDSLRDNLDERARGVWKTVGEFTSGVIPSGAMQAIILSSLQATNHEAKASIRFLTLGDSQPLRVVETRARQDEIDLACRWLSAAMLDVPGLADYFNQRIAALEAELEKLRQQKGERDE